mmetsp:Transcript_91565/g.158743  ORF Transcript_91565/g.158743 Transcript_91565/m.158743 type:complete len:242 (+) Transcript_91565:3628-4353(+)
MGLHNLLGRPHPLRLHKLQLAVLAYLTCAEQTMQWTLQLLLSLQLSQIDGPVPGERLGLHLSPEWTHNLGWCNLWRLPETASADFPCLGCILSILLFGRPILYPFIYCTWGLLQNLLLGPITSRAWVPLIITLLIPTSEEPLVIRQVIILNEELLHILIVVLVSTTLVLFISSKVLCIPIWLILPFILREDFVVQSCVHQRPCADPSPSEACTRLLEGAVVDRADGLVEVKDLVDSFEVGT